MKKFLLWSAAIIAVIVLAMAFLFDPILELAIEKLGSKMTDTKVSLDYIDFSPFSGKCELKAFAVDNPENFKTEKLMQCEIIRIKMKPLSVLSDKIIINEIFIDSPEINYETGKGGSNIDAIMKNVESFSAKEEGKEEEEKVEVKKDKEGKKLQVDLFVVKNPKVTVTTAITGNKPTVIAMPDIKLENIGSGEGGASKAQVIQKISAVFAANITKVVTDVVTNIPGSLGESIKSTEEKIKEGFSNLFGGSDDDEEE